MATPPGEHRSWVGLLPAPFDQDPIVVVVLAPEGSKWQTREGTDRIARKPVRIGFLSVDGNALGVQVMEPAIDNYFDQVRLCNANGIQMAIPAHVGRLSELPQAFMAQDDLMPLVFLRDQMSETYLNLSKAFAEFTTKQDN